jgi:hypothetical protein
MKRQTPPKAQQNNANGAQAGDGQVGTPPPPTERQRGRRLRTLTHVKGGLAAVVRGLEAGSMDPRRGNSLIYAYSTLAGVMAGDVVAEIAELRRVLENERSRLDA